MYGLGNSGLPIVASTHRGGENDLPRVPEVGVNDMEINWEEVISDNTFIIYNLSIMYFFYRKHMLSRSNLQFF